MKNEDLEKIVHGGKRVLDSALALLVCLFGASLLLIIMYILNLDVTCK
jgi:hypothetical protein